MSALGRLAVNVSLDSAEFTAGVTDIQREAARAMRDIESSIQAGVMAFGALAASTAAAGAAFAQVVNGIDALNDLSDATGTSIENASALEDVALRAGHSFESVTKTLVKFNDVLNKANGGSEVERTLVALGLSVKELNSLDPAEALRKTAEAFNRFTGDGEKARAAQLLFGRSIAEVAAFLKDLGEQTKLVGTVMTPAAAEADKFNKQIASLKKDAIDAARAVAGPLVTSINGLIVVFKDGQKAGDSFLATLIKQTELYRLFSGGSFVIDTYDEIRKQIERTDKSLQAANLTESQRLVLLERRRSLEARLLANPTRSLEGVDTRAEDARLLRMGKKELNLGGGPKAGKVPGLSEAEKEAQALERLIEQLQSKEGGLDGGFYKNWEILNREFEKGTLALDRLIELQGLLLRQQPAMVAAQKAQAEAAAAYAKPFEDEQAGIEAWQKTKAAIDARASASAEAYIKSIQLETSMIGMNSAERAKANAVRTLESMRISETSEEYAKYLKQIQDALNVQQQTQKAQQQFESLSSSITQLLRGNGDAVKSLVDNMINEFLRLQVVEPILRSIFSSAGGIGGGLGGGLGGFLGGLFSFEGGGSTGNGPRSGGLDGKGGYLAVVHPREQVVDLTKGQGAGGRSVVIHINNVIGSVASQEDVVKGMAVVHQQIKGELGRSMRMGGAFA